MLFLGINLCFAQEIPKDSIYSYQNPYSVTNKYTSVRVGGGFQKNFYSELGVSFQKNTSGCTGFFSQDFYTAVEWNPIKSKDIFGLKVGYEVNAYFLNIGLETKYLTNFTKK